jgi:GntR family transcriptional regulator/MocR family aminotransferase
MSKPVAGSMLAITLDRTADAPLFQQLYDQIRVGVLGGRISSGTRLPSTRTLAADLGISRTTVVNAFDQLVAEGYLKGRVGSGTRVVSTLPDTKVLSVAVGASSVRLSPLDACGPLSRRLAARIQQRWPIALPSGAVRAARPLWPGNPDLAAFPRELWARLAARHWRNASPSLLGYGDPMGYEPLRVAIADYARRVRGVRCDPRQVLVISGSQQGLNLCAQILLEPGDVAAMEDPGYPGARAALAAAGADIVPTPVDQDGLVVAALKKRRVRSPRLVYVTPSHHCPLGMRLSLARRLELIELANGANAWIVEDDYNSEYRYFGRPLPALQSLDTCGRVIYVGTVSKTLIPGLRIGYAILPEPLVDWFVRARAAMDRQPPGVDQAVLAEFMSAGWYERHIRQAKVRYMERQEWLVDAIRAEMLDLLDPLPVGAGTYLAAYLKNGMASSYAASLAEAHGVQVVPLSLFYMKPAQRDGLILGYGAYTGEQIRGAVKRLSQALRSSGTPPIAFRVSKRPQTSASQ